MSRVSVPIINNPDGLHEGHKALIQFAKQYGDVYVALGERVQDRNKYIETGKTQSEYNIDAKKMKQDCDKIDVALVLPDFLEVSESRRILMYNRAVGFMETCKDLLISKLYIKEATFALASSLMRPQTLERQYDFLIYGPEPLPFFFKKIASMAGTYGERPIFKQVVKDKDNIKIGSSWKNAPINKKRARQIIDAARGRYKVGNNSDLVEEINNSMLSTEEWKVYEMIVYEGGFVEGRIEHTAFCYPTNPGLAVVHNIDYFE